MTRQLCAWIAAVMVCMPIGGMANISVAARLGQLDFSAQRCWLGPKDILIALGCAAVLTLVDRRRRTLTVSD